MVTIDIKLKTYEELQLNTNIYLKDKEIERLSKEVDMWNRKYNEQFNIINELEKHINEMIFETPSEKELLENILNKLKELQGGNNDKE